MKFGKKVNFLYQHALFSQALSPFLSKCIRTVTDLEILIRGFSLTEKQAQLELKSKKRSSPALLTVSPTQKQIK